MGRYAVYSSEVTDRYPRVLTDSRGGSLIESAYLAPAEAELDARMAPYFPVPFSSNNLTAKDLVIDMTVLRMGIYKESMEVLRESVDARIKSLIDGTMFMVTTSGTVAAQPSSGVYSTTAAYHPVFGMGDILDMKPDDDRVDDEADSRG